MAQIPTQQPLTQEQAYIELQAWYLLQQQLDTVKGKEIVQRKMLAGFYFPKPDMGTNRLDLGGGFDLKLVHKQNIKVLQEEVDAVKPAHIKKFKLPWDDLFVYKPSLNMSVYNKLSAEQKLFVDNLLEISDATPSLEIVPVPVAVVVAAPTTPARDEPKVHYVVSDVAEDTQPGQFFRQDDVWYKLTSDYEWDVVMDPDTLEALNKTIEEPEAALAATPKKATAKRSRAKAKA